MSVKVSSWVWEHSKAKGSTRLVLLAIADIASDDGTAHHYARSISFIARKVRLSDNAVRNHIRALEDLGELRTEVGGGRGSNCYTVVMSTPPDSGGVPEPAQTTPPESDPHPPSARGGTPPESDPHPPSARGGHHPVLIPSIPVPIPSTSLTLVPEPDVDELFTRFWALYPRKIDKPGSKRKFKKAMKAATVAEISTGLKRWVAHWETSDPQFIPHPSTWLNREGWNDPLPEAKVSAPKSADTIIKWASQ